MAYEAKFAEVKREINQASSHKFLNLRHNSEHVDHVISGTGRPQENRIFRSLKTHKRSLFTQFSRQGSLHEI